MQDKATNPYHPDRVANRLETGRKRGYTEQYARMSEEDRATWVKALFAEGKDNASIIAETGLKAQWVSVLRGRMAKLGVVEGRKRKELKPLATVEVEGESGGIKLDDGAYMAAVRRLKLQPPQSWRFGRDISPLPSRPIVIRTHTAACWCADEGEDYRPTAAQKARHANG